MTSTATARPLHRSPARPTTPKPLRVVQRQPQQAQPLFVGACLALLVAGLLGVLMLNTAMAKGSFVLGDLQDQSNQLADAEEALSHAIDAQSAPSVLAQRAKDMGMVPSETAAFLRLSDGKVLGVAEGATAQKEFTVATQGSSAAAAARPAATPQATVRTVGSVTTTTVTTVRGANIEVTTTSVDARTGETRTTTSTRAAAPRATPGATPDESATPSPNASERASDAPSERASDAPSVRPSGRPSAPPEGDATPTTAP